MNSTHIISQDVFDKIRSRFSNLEMGDENGDITIDPKEARFFDFDFVLEGKNLGRVSISINESGTLKVFYSQGILEDTDDFVHHLWYDFLREMRMFAKRRLLRFDTRDITKSNLDKDDFQYLANNGPKDTDMNMSESVKFEGSKKTSYRVLEKTKLIAKHHKGIENESNGARSRKNNIKALFIENSEGERFKYPFIHIAGAKAMQRHVANGGLPYDDIGEAIVRMSEQISQLSEFKRKINHDNMNQSVNEIAGRANSKLESLRRQVEGLSSQSYYDKYKESFVPNVGANELVIDQATMEDYRSKFTIQNFKEELAQYFPLIHSIMQEAGTIDLEDYVSEGEECDVCHQAPCECDEDTNEEKTIEGFSSFEEWVERVSEGKLEPDTIMNLKDLLDQGLTLDADGESAINALQGIGVHDEELEAELQKLSDPAQGGNPKNDPKDTILAWLAKDDPESAQHLGYQSEPTPTAPVSAVDGEENPVGEEMTPIPTKATPKDIAEMVYSMYNREEENFPRGKTGVIAHVSKELGEEAGALAEKLVNHLQPENGMAEGPADQPVHPNDDADGEHGWDDAYAQESVELESIKALAGIKESVTDRTSYQVAKFLFDKGLRYNPQNEKQIINKMDDAMIAMNISAKDIQYLLKHDSDFIRDTLSELQHMEQAVDELAMNSPLAQPGIPPMEEGVGDAVKKAVKKVAGGINKVIGHGSDEEMRKDLQRKSGAPVTGKKPDAKTNEDFDIILKLAGLAK